MSARLFDVAFFKSCKDKTPRRLQMTQEELFARLYAARSDPWVSVAWPSDWASVDKVSHEEKGDGDALSPVFYPAGAKRKKENVQRISCFFIDLDGEDEAGLEVVLDRLRALGACACAWETWSSRWGKNKERGAWRIAVPLARDVSAAVWLPAWQRLTNALAPGKNDEATKDCSRLHFLPRAPAMVPVRDGDGVVLRSFGALGWRELAGEPLDIERLPQVEATAPKPAPTPMRPVVVARDTSAWARAALEAECNALARTTEGGRNNQTNRAAFNVGQIVGGGHLDLGEAEAAVLNAALATGLGEEEATTAVHSGLTAGKLQPRHPPERERPVPLRVLRHGDEASAEADAAWQDQFSINREGRRGTLGNAILILEHGQEFRAVQIPPLRLNRSAGVVEVCEPPAWTEDPAGTRYPRTLSDNDLSHIAVLMERTYKVVCPLAMVDAAVAVEAQRNAYDPLTDWLGALTWDGVPRLSGWLHRYLGAGASPYVSAVGRAFCISAVARAFVPGCKVDTTIVLEGEQGTGKSTALRTLAGPAGFMDHLPDLGSKDAAMALHKAWIHELGELAAMNKTEVEKYKQFLAQREDVFRPTFARKTIEQKRRCVFAATTNRTDYLKDTTGNRRFWPVATTAIDLKALESDRDQLWAEAVFAFRAGEPWDIRDEALVAAAKEAQSERLEEDAWHMDIERIVAGRTDVTLDEVFKELGVETHRKSRMDVVRVTNVLRVLRWTPERKRVAGVRGSFWNPRQP